MSVTNREMVERLLVKLGVLVVRLREMEVPSAGNQESAGKPPARRMSKPPTPIGLLSVDEEITRSAREVFSNVAADLGVHLPSGGLVSWSEWGLVHVAKIAELAWVGDLVDELLGWSRWLEEITGDHRSLLPIGEAVRMCRQADVDVTSAEVRRFVKYGQVECVETAGQTLVSLADVLAAARSAASR